LPEICQKAGEKGDYAHL